VSPSSTSFPISLLQRRSPSPQTFFSLELYYRYPLSECCLHPLSIDVRVIRRELELPLHLHFCPNFYILPALTLQACTIFNISTTNQIFNARIFHKKAYPLDQCIEPSPSRQPCLPLPSTLTRRTYYFDGRRHLGPSPLRMTRLRWSGPRGQPNIFSFLHLNRIAHKSIRILSLQDICPGIIALVKE